ncbi:MAG: glycosyltransferase [Ignavibacteriales bacterium]|nr:glycosyltransferase [Ignavibacteriales bacterium]
MLELNLQIFIILYVIQVVIFLIGLYRIRDHGTNDQVPFVSVVIAARNEEQNIADCLESVLQQTYPKDKFEVILVNDNSTDRTGEICQSFVRRFENFITFVAQEDPMLRGKTNALNQGIEKARGEIILITDADCTVPPTWIEHTAKRYTPSVGIVGGMTLQKASSNFEGMQSLDWAYLLGLASATVSMHNPLSTIGNNLSFRKSAYGEVGGYKKIPFSVTEDFMLFQSIVKTRKWDYLYPIDPNVLVLSKPCQTLKELVRQKHRWGKGGLDMKLSGFLIMVIGFSTHGFTLFTFLLGNFVYALTALFIKLIADYVFLFKVLQRLKRTDLLKYFYWFELYYTIYILLLPFVVFFGGKVVWKGRSY